MNPTSGGFFARQPFRSYEIQLYRGHLLRKHVACSSLLEVMEKFPAVAAQLKKHADASAQVCGITGNGTHHVLLALDRDNGKARISSDSYFLPAVTF